jgi:hypothetical protein
MATAEKTTLRSHAGAARGKATFLGWPAVSVVVVMLATALYDPLSRLGSISAAGVAIQPIDLALVCIVIATLLYGLATTRWKPAPRPLWPLLTLILLLAWPVILGVWRDHELQTVMFQGRVIVYYALFFVYWQLIPNRRASASLILVVVAIAAVTAAYALVARVAGWQWINSMSGVVTAQGVALSRGFGWWSAFPWCVYGAVAAFAYAWLGRASRNRRTLMALVSAALVASSLSTLIRGDVVGLVLGFVVVLYAGLRRQYAKAWIIRRFWKGVPVALLLVGLVLVLAVTIGGTYVDAVAERVSSIVAPVVSASGSSGGTRELRIEAMRDGLASSVRHPLGVGYGNEPGREASTSALNYLAGHNQVAWMGYFLGIVGILVALLCVVRIGVHLARSSRHEATYEWAAVASTAILAAILGQSLGAAYLFGSPHVYPMVPVFLAIAWVFGSVPGDRGVREDV